MSIHDGRRERLREQFVNHGLDSFVDHQVVELLLCYAIPRRDVNPDAKALMKHFGSLAAILEASPEELKQVHGIGPAAAAAISFITQIGRRYQIDKAKSTKHLLTTEDIGAFVQPLYYGATDEIVYLVFLDGQRRVLHLEKLSEGSINAASFNVRKAAEIAFSRKAHGIVLAHNHPGGVALPSSSDIAATERFLRAIALLGIRLIDHIVLAEDDFVSMRDSGYLTQMESRLEG